MKKLLPRILASAIGLGAACVAIAPGIAQSNPYSTQTRATFLAGCLQENAPDYSDEAAVRLRLQTCVCLLDRFQAEYTNAQFTQLFTDLDRKLPAAEREVDDFLVRQLTDCV